jgi:hypothetical protein
VSALGEGGVRSKILRLRFIGTGASSVFAFAMAFLCVFFMKWCQKRKSASMTTNIPEAAPLAEQPVPPIIVPDGVILPTTIPAPYQQTLSDETKLQLIASRDTVRIFTVIDGIFAVAGFLSTAFGGYVVTTVMCAIGYVGARDLVGPLVWLYAYYALMLMMVCFFVIFFGQDVSDNTVIALAIDGILNCWVASRALQLHRCIQEMQALGIPSRAQLRDL